MVRMEGYEDRYSAELSGGQQQRVALARALVLEPEILLFDEPLSNLDASLREHMRFEIKALLNKLKITSIYVTHDQNEAMVIGDRIAVMSNGRIEQIGSAEDVYYRSATDFVARFIGLANVFDAKVIGRDEGGRIRLQAPGLGEVVAGNGAHGLTEAAKPVCTSDRNPFRSQPSDRGCERQNRPRAAPELSRPAFGFSDRYRGDDAAGDQPEQGHRRPHVAPNVHVSFEPADCLVLST